MRGLNVGCMPSLCGKQFSQNIALYAVLTISLLGYCSKGNVFNIAQTLIFTVLMNLSISGTCSSQLVMLSIMPICSICFWACSNCPSASIRHILKPLALYASIWFRAIIVDIFSFFISSAIPKCIAHDVIITKGISLMYMMSTARFTFLIVCIYYNSWWLCSCHIAFGGSQIWP